MYQSVPILTLLALCLAGRIGAVFIVVVALIIKEMQTRA